MSSPQSTRQVHRHRFSSLPVRGAREVRWTYLVFASSRKTVQSLLITREVQYLRFKSFNCDDIPHHPSFPPLSLRLGRMAGGKDCFLREVGQGVLFRVYGGAGHAIGVVQVRLLCFGSAVERRGSLERSRCRLIVKFCGLLLFFNFA